VLLAGRAQVHVGVEEGRAAGGARALEQLFVGIVDECPGRAELGHRTAAHAHVVALIDRRARSSTCTSRSNRSTAIERSVDEPLGRHHAGWGSPKV